MYADHTCTDVPKEWQGMVDEMREVRAAAAKFSKARKSYNAAVEDCKKATMKAHSAGQSEYTLMREFDVSRTTIRRWLGKM